MANYVHIIHVADCQSHESTIMMQGLHINKMAISSTGCLGNDPLSVPNQQVLPTCLAAHVIEPFP